MATNKNVDKDFSNVYKHKEIKETYLGKNKQNKYHFTQIDIAAKPMSRPAIVDELSKINRDIPKSHIAIIIQDYERLMRKEIITNGRFRINGILDIESKLWNTKRDKFEKVPNIEEEIYINPPTTVRLKVRLNKNLKDDYRWARRYEETLSFKLSPEDWYKPFIIEKPKHIIKAEQNFQKYLNEKNNNNK